jgi:hypothetical protein
MNLGSFSAKLDNISASINFLKKAILEIIGTKAINYLKEFENSPL